MKKPLLISVSLLTLGVVTGIYAQSVGATSSIVDKMKAVAHSFTLATSLNPIDAGLTSDPVKGKKTGDILTAGEWNRMLELVGEGGGSGGAGWVDVPLNDTSDFDPTCLYRYKTGNVGHVPYLGTSPYYFPNAVDSKQLIWWIDTQVHHISSTSKTVYRIDGVGYAPSGGITKIEKLCGGDSAAGGGISNVEVVTSQDVGAAAGTSYANRWSEANCPAGKKIVSGGCTYPNTRNSFIHNAPKSDLSGWACGGIAYNGDISPTSAEYPTRPTAYAVCGVYGSSGTVSSSWVDVPLTDTSSFDIDNCEYRFRVSGLGGNSVIPGFSQTHWYDVIYKSANAIANAGWYYLKSDNKEVLYVIDASNNNVLNVTTAWGVKVSKVQKRCN